MELLLRTLHGRRINAGVRFLALLHLATGISLLLVTGAGCGPLSPRAVPASPVKLGVVAPFSGVRQPEGERLLQAVKLAVADRKARRGPAGRTVELVVHDDRGEPDQGATAARRLVADLDVVAVLGHPTTASAESALSVYRGAGMPVGLLGSVDAEPAPDEVGFVRLAPSPSDIAGAAAGFALQRGARTAAVVAGPLARDLSGAEALRRAAQQAGLRLVRTEALHPASTDYRGAVARLSAVSPDVLFIAASLPASAAFWREAAGSAGFAILVDDDTASHEFAAIAGAAARRAYAPSPISGWAASPPLAAFAERYRLRWAQDASPDASLAYDAAGLLLEALDRAGEGSNGVSRLTVGQAITELRSYGGITGRVVFDATGRSSAPALFFVSAAGDAASGRPTAAAQPAAPAPAR